MAMMKLVTIIAESTLEALIIKSIKQFDISGYSIADTKGEGSHGVRAGDWDAARNITLSTVCEPEIARQMVSELKVQFRDYAFFAYLSDVEVI
jgi:nitrogen regulatory protein P-II 2